VLITPSFPLLVSAVTWQKNTLWYGTAGLAAVTYRVSRIGWRFIFIYRWQV